MSKWLQVAAIAALLSMSANAQVADAAKAPVERDMGGDALVAGGKVRLGAPVSQSLYAAGGRITVNTSIGRNARIAG